MKDLDIFGFHYELIKNYKIYIFVFFLLHPILFLILFEYRIMVI
jgi:hypothetical protein